MGEMPIGAEGLIAGSDLEEVRFAEMGITAGGDVRIIRRAPLGDPVELEIRGYRLCMRAADADKVTVTVKDE